MNNYLFGFGSIINDTSRLRTRQIDAQFDTCKDTDKATAGSDSFTGGQYDDAIAAAITAPGDQRQWNFRSNTGFTALGLLLSPPSADLAERKLPDNADDGVFGVLFPVSDEELNEFDHREQNYQRHLIPLKDINILPSYGCPDARQRAQRLMSNEDFNGSMTRVWTYVPSASHRLPRTTCGFKVSVFEL